MQIALRPRRPWEAMDLGLAMAQEWWRPALGVWLILTVPLFVVLSLSYGGTAVPILVVWLLKPVFERALLYIYSRAVFGDEPDLLETLRALPKLLWGTGLFWHLTLGRLFDPARSYRLPVYQLEGLKGRARSERLRVISARDTGYAIGMLVTFVHIEFFLAIGFFAFGLVMIPMPIEFQWGDLIDGGATAALMIFNVVYLLAYTIVAPVFVASGFALYLNRRTILEAWDIELNLRRMATRIEPILNRVVTVALTFGLLLFTTVSPQPVFASDDIEADPTLYRWSAKPHKVITEVLASEDFGKKETVTRWRLRDPDPGEDEGSESNPDMIPPLAKLGNVVAKAIEIVFWIGTAGLIAVALLYIAKNSGPIQDLIKQLRRRKIDVPIVIGSLALKPDELPSDIEAHARQAWVASQHREALSLLYRGSILRLLALGVRLPNSATEGDVLVHAQDVLQAASYEALKGITETWQVLAYGHRVPASETFEQLCQQYRMAFGATPR